MEIFILAWENKFGILKHQLGAVSWGKAALAAGVSLSWCTQFACATVGLCGRGSTGSLSTMFWSMTALRLYCGVWWWVLAGWCKLELTPAQYIWTPISRTGRWGQCCPLPSFWDGAVCPAEFCSRLGHGLDWCFWGSVYALLRAYWGRWSEPYRQNSKHDSHGSGGVTAPVKYQLSGEDWASTALGTAVGLWMQPEMSCPCLHMAPSSVPQVTIPSWPSPGSTCITYTCTTVSMRVFLAIVDSAKVTLSNLLQGW